MKKIIISILFLYCTNTISQQQQEDVGSQLSDAGSSVYNGGADFLSGLGQSVGIVPSSYKYSFRFFNDTPGAVMAAIQDETNIMGANFAGDIKDGYVVDTFSDSGSYKGFKNIHLYIRIWLVGDASQISSYKNLSTIGAAAGLGIGAIPGGVAVTSKMADSSFYDKKVLTVAEENDPNVYYYHAYTKKGKPKGEYLGVKDTTSEFAGVFYNGLPEASGNEVSLVFNKNGNDFTATLEPNSFSLLQSDSTIENSIRPADEDTRNFVFQQGNSTLATIPVSSLGIGNLVLSEDGKTYEDAGPMTYTYEVWADSNNKAQIGMQGLFIGNFDQPVKQVRDINPMECKVWYQSAAQSSESQDDTTDYSVIPMDVPDSLWVSYKTKDQTVQQKIEPGSVVDLNLLRPQLSEQKTTLFCVFIQSTDDTKSIEFLDRLHDGSIGTDALYTEITTATELVDMTANPNGIIVDTDGSGLTGYVVLSDVMYPRGLGYGPYYYSVPSVDLQVGMLANMLYFSDESYDESGALQTTVMQDFAQNVMQWISDYPTNASSVETAVSSYVTKNGNTSLFDDSQQLTAYAQTMLQNFLTGPVSIANPPIIRQAGTTWYSFTMGSVPTGWPTTS